MKKLLVTGVLFVTASAGAAELPAKNLCLLEGTGCPSGQLTLQEMIAKLQVELALGRQVYTEQELRKLQMKLEEYEYYLWMVTRPSGK